MAATPIHSMISILLVAAVAVTVCRVSAQQPAEVCIGVVLPITGEKNLESLVALEAMKMSIDDINADPSMAGTKIAIISDHALIDSAGFPTFGAAKMYDQILNRKCANGTSPVVIVGDLSETVCHQMSPVAALLQVPLIGIGARDPDFILNRNSNPYFISFRAGLKDEADAIKALIIKYGWTSFVLWHSDSVFGQALTPSFSGSGLEMVDVPIPANDQGAEAARALTRILTLRFRVIVVHAEPQLARLMLNLSQRAGMLNGDYIIIGGQAWSQGTDTALTVFNQEEQSYLQGVIGFGVPIPGPVITPFMARLAARTPQLYPPYMPEFPVNTRSLGYDSMKAVSVAFKYLMRAGLPVNGVNMMKALVGPNMTFNSWAGPGVKMNAQTGSRLSRYILTNFRNGAFQPVGWWTQGEGVLLNPGAQIIWPGFNTEERPSQFVPRIHVSLSSVLPETAISVAVLYGLTAALVHYLIYLNTDHEVIKASSPVFCHIILAGADVCFIMSGLSSLSIDVACSVVPSLIAISFSLIFGALVAKTYRIHKIFNSEGLRIKTPTNKELYMFTGVLVGIDLIIIACWMSTDKPTANWIDSARDVTRAYEGCVMNNASSWSLAFLVPKAAILVFGAYLAYKVRHLNHNFNEAKYISIALYNVLLLSAILFGLISAFPDSIDTVYTLKSIGTASVAWLTVLILFGPKFWDIYITKDWVDYHSNSSYVSGVLVHKSSKHSVHNPEQPTATPHAKGGAVAIGGKSNGTPHHHHRNGTGSTGTGTGAGITGGRAQPQPQRSPSPARNVNQSSAVVRNDNSLVRVQTTVNGDSARRSAGSVGTTASGVSTKQRTSPPPSNGAPVSPITIPAGASGFGLNTRTAPASSAPGPAVSIRAATYTLDNDTVITTAAVQPPAGYRMATSSNVPPPPAPHIITSSTPVAGSTPTVVPRMLTGVSTTSAAVVLPGTPVDTPHTATATAESNAPATPAADSVTITVQA